MSACQRSTVANLFVSGCQNGPTCTEQSSDTFWAACVSTRIGTVASWEVLLWLQQKRINRPKGIEISCGSLGFSRTVARTSSLPIGCRKPGRRTRGTEDRGDREFSEHHLTGADGADRTVSSQAKPSALNAAWRRSPWKIGCIHLGSSICDRTVGRSCGRLPEGSGSHAAPYHLIPPGACEVCEVDRKGQRADRQGKPSAGP